MRIRVICAGIIVVLGILPAAAGQPCEPAWSDDFASGDLNGPVYALAVYDEDAAGPAHASLYAGGAFIAEGDELAYYIASWVGRRWNPVGGGMNGPVHALAVYDEDDDGPIPPALYAGGAFSVAGGVPAGCIARWDGQAWSALGDGVRGDYPHVYALAVLDDDGAGPILPALYVGGWFAQAGDVAAASIGRWGGQQWSALGTGVSGQVYALAGYDEDAGDANPPVLCVGGRFATAGGTAAANLARWSAAGWSPAGGGTNDVVYALATFDDDGSGPRAPRLYVGGAFTLAGGASADRFACWNGATLTPVVPGTQFGIGEPAVKCLAVGDADGPGPGAAMLYAGGTFRSDDAIGKAIVSWDGTSFAPLAAGATYCTGYACTISINACVAYDPDGDGPDPPGLYAAGEFSLVGGIAALNIARWDGVRWTPIGTGVGGLETCSVSSLAVFPDDAPGFAPSPLYVGGNFSLAGAIEAKGIARWDGERWSPLGSGLNGTAAAQLVFDDDGPGPRAPALYVGGTFTTAGGSPASRIARWDGASWSALGSGLSGVSSGSAVALASFDDDGAGPHGAALIVGGGFNAAGGAAAYYIAAWDGQRWYPLGFGMNNWVHALAVFDADGPGPQAPALIAGGAFHTAGTQTADYIARWDGVAWSPLGAGFDGAVRALAVFDDDDAGPHLPALYAGGGFTRTGAQTVNRIARWDGSQWSAMGGFDDTVRVLAVFDEDGSGPLPRALVAGGDFTRADGLAAPRIARWDGGGWLALGSGVSGSANSDPSVRALAADESAGTYLRPPRLYAGGDFFRLGVRRNGKLAVWVGCRDAGAGDLNCDRRIDFDDINPFVTALVSRATYESAFPGCPWLNGDLNGDDTVDFDDINPFVQELTEP